ncbi:MAG: hypothetical protein HQ488_00805 [Parcubacteria group bacterium]|nr:hypothetical protein [Parcubacteria group bacterium]
MDPELLIVKLWREFKETTLEMLKLLLLKELVERDDDFVEVTDRASAIRCAKAYDRATAKVEAIRARRGSKTLVIQIFGIAEEIVHSVLCHEEFCTCRPDGKLTSRNSEVRVRFELPSPGLIADSSCFSSFVMA